MKASTSPDVKNETSQSDAVSSITSTTVDPRGDDTGSMENGEMDHGSTSSAEGEGPTLLAPSQFGRDSNKATQKNAEVSATGAEKKAEDQSSKTSNLIGKINNLVSTDLNNIANGRGFLYVRECPLLFASLKRVWSIMS